MKRNFKIVSLLTIFTIAINIFSILVLMRPADAAVLTSAKDTMSSMVAGAATHTILFQTPSGAQFGDTITITFPADTWTGGVTQLTDTAITLSEGATSALGTSLTVAAAPAADTWGATFTSGVLTLVAPDSGTGEVVATHFIQVVIAGVTNAAVGLYDVSIAGTFGDTQTMQILIVDSDTVDVTGYIATSITFDLDTGYGDDGIDCALDTCLGHSADQLPYPSNYTVDLGNLTIGAVNASGEIEVTHSDTNEGYINYIYFDLSTNASSGVVVTMESVGTRPGYLDGPGTLTEDIPSVIDGAELVAHTAGYGYKWGVLGGSGQTNLGTNWSAIGDGGTVTTNSNCYGNATTYCAIPTSPLSVFSASTSIEGVRGKIQIGAAIDGTMVPGTYEDILQFIVTSTF